MKKNSGFTLIEVLIAMLILALGLLGMAGLQMTGLRNNLSSYQRSQATLLSYDMADRMRANIADAQLYSDSIYITSSVSGASEQTSCTVATVGCNPALMAQHDLFEWGQRLGNLPDGTGTITVAGSFYTITVTWREDKKNDVDKSFAMSFSL